VLYSVNKCFIGSIFLTFETFVVFIIYVIFFSDDLKVALHTRYSILVYEAWMEKVDWCTRYLYFKQYLFPADAL